MNIVVEMLPGIRELEMKKENLLMFHPLTAPYVVETFEKLAAGQSYLKISREFNTMLLASPRVCKNWEVILG